MLIWKKQNFDNLIPEAKDMDFRCACCDKMKPMKQAWSSTLTNVCSICTSCYKAGALPPTKDIARLVRQEIKRLQRKHEIPFGRVSVRTVRYQTTTDMISVGWNPFDFEYELKRGLSDKMKKHFKQLIQKTKKQVWICF